MLQTVDTLWKDHLLDLDHLKEGIGLRGYGQRDPLVEYKKESFQLFEAMKEGIEEQILQYLFRFEVQQAPVERPSRAEVEPSPTGGGQTPAEAAATSSASSRRAAAELEKRRQKEQEPELPGLLRPDVRRRLCRLDREGRGTEGRPQRPVPVRLREEVQEVPRRTRAGRRARLRAGSLRYFPATLLRSIRRASLPSYTVHSG